MLNLERIKEELAVQSQLKEKIDIVLQEAPEGNIFFQKTGPEAAPLPYHDHYQDGKRHRTALKNAEEGTVKALLLKRYAKRILKKVERNIKALQGASEYAPFTEADKSFGGDLYRECREHFFGAPLSNPTFEALKERQNPFHPEHMNVRSELGLFRSREELSTAKAMNDLGLRFKYETALPVGMYNRYPDFAVLHPKTGAIIYIEYAGKPADPGYQKDLQQRIRDYANVGVFLGVNLFIIAPTPGEGFDLVQITERLKGIFGI
ncbi:MAG: hypothetical protein J6A42_10420 [Firmicutes bacterium]|nr:hypothetical protein [Bacillota bacterium]